MFIDLTNLRGKKVGVALSGGSDSVALTHYLAAHKSEYGYDLFAVNCEHGIRGEESLKDTAFVEDFCRTRQIPLFLFAEDCPKKAREERTSLETAARNFRYACFEQLLSENKVDFIATAHHANDNAETVLFNLCRGSSLSGAKGITERKGFLRPLLFVTKREIEEYIKENDLPFVTDCTNDDEDITRNAIRKQVIPVLEREIPAAVKNVSRFSLTAKEDDDYLYKLADRLITEENGDVFLTLCDERPLFRRAALSAMKRKGIEKDYTAEHLNDIFSLQYKQNGSKISLPHGVNAVKEYGKICFYYNKEKSERFLPLSFGKNDMGSCTVTLTHEPQANALFFDKDKLPEGCVLRFRQDGDFFTKFGGARKKLKEFFQERKIPLKDRNFIPLIAKDKEIYCVCGVEISDKIKTTEQSDACYITITKNDEKIKE